MLLFTNALFMQESDMPVDWDLTSGSTFLNYTYPASPHVKFQLLCVRMLGLLITHGMWLAANNTHSHLTALCPGLPGEPVPER